MGQPASTHRRAELDDKKLRAAGRQQNATLKTIADREEAPTAGGAFGRGAARPAPRKRKPS
jgi:hypothetical protein